MFWIQYFVAFDNQEQRSLLTSFRRGFQDYQSQTSGYLETFRILFAEWWKDVKGENGFETRAAAVGYAAGAGLLLVAGILLLFALIRVVRRKRMLSQLLARLRPKSGPNIIDFYEHMVRILADRGMIRLPHQTPLEFAAFVGLPAVGYITEEYNRVRFGAVNDPDATQLSVWMDELRASLAERAETRVPGRSD
jgi:hypothetical protein